MLPHEKHEFSAGWRAAQKGGPAGCTTGWASGLQKRACWRAVQKSGPAGCKKGPALLSCVQQPPSLPKVHIF